MKKNILLTILAILMIEAGFLMGCQNWSNLYDFIQLNLIGGGLFILLIKTMKFIL